MATPMLLRFRLGDDAYGLRIEDLQEIVEIPTEPKMIPRAPLEVAGLIDLRGRVVTLLSLEVLLEATAPPGPEHPKAAILYPPRSNVGLLIRGEVDILRLGEDAGVRGEPGTRGAWVREVLRDGEGLVHVLDAAAIAEGVQDRILDRVKGL